MQTHASIHGLESSTVSRLREVPVYPGDLKINVSETFLGSNRQNRLYYQEIKIAVQARPSY